MTSFNYYYNEYKKNGCQDAGIELSQNIFPTEVPTCTKGDVVASAFFAGKNVTMEEISTCGNFRYSATVSVKDALVCAQEELKQHICSGLKELGIEYRRFDIKKIPTRKRVYYEVTITM